MNKIPAHEFYADGQHGWLRVPRKRLEKLGIHEKISSFSYMRGDWVYLEEDCDMGIYYDALFKHLNYCEAAPEERHNFHIEFNHRIKASHTNKRSRLRSYESYHHIGETEKKFREIVIEEMLKKFISKESQRAIKNADLRSLKYWNNKYGINAGSKIDIL
jgi:hypothetical protein